MCARRIHLFRKLREDLPLRTRLSNARPGNLGTECDAALRRRLSTATRNFVAGRCRKEEHRLSWIYKHLAADHNVLMHAEWNLGERARNRVGIRHRLQEVPANPEHVNLASFSGVKLLRR
ncbi:MAG: hypothetical protein RI921_1101 [Chloroflexota bacterium]